jgi:hypothetical protein
MFHSPGLPPAFFFKNWWMIFMFWVNPLCLIAEFRQHGYNMSGLIFNPLKMEERNDSYHYQPVRT